jgi:glycosyltransferase involved in cell wall biosynthesis
MKVLLISPVRGLDPPCGDITYTEELISNMGQGVDYVTYDKAIADGSLVELTRRNWRIAPFLLILNKLINFLRKRQFLFWEPFRFFFMKPGVYDLVHVHVFPFRFLNKCCPILYSAGAPLGDVYRDRRKFSKVRTSVLSSLESFLCRVFLVNHSTFFLPQVDCMAVYTDYYCDYISKVCKVHKGRVVKLPISLGNVSVNRHFHTGVRFGFVAYDFDAKGGRTLLAAFRKVRVLDESVTLHIVGNVPSELQNEVGVTLYGTVDRDFITNQFLPMIDVFVYPTPHDCFSYVMLEALRAGCAVCTSDYVSMPEAVDYGNAGLISQVGDIDTLSDNLIQMLDSAIRSEFQTAARRQFEKKFDSAVVLSNLYELYINLVSEYPETNLGNEIPVK